LRTRILVCLFAYLTWFASSALQNGLNAQTTNATLSGQITDTSGAAVPDAKVVIVNDATNVKYETKTNRDGIYVEPNLPPSTYHIEITKPGFKTVMQPGIELHVEDARAANYTLQVGTISETVTVQAQSHMINTQDATISTTIDRNFAENLPLNGRTFQTLILLTPGVVFTNPTFDVGQFSVNGQRSNTNYFEVDGVSANISAPRQFGGGQFAGAQAAGQLPGQSITGGTNGLVSVDGMQEFKIQTSSYAPEFGRSPGGQVSIQTRSGTNRLHGALFEYLRNDKLDANDWFNDANALPKAEERQNDFGGVLGGPLIKDRTFFFLSYEGLRLRLPQSKLQTVPSLRLRNIASPALQPILNSFPIPTGPEFLDGTTQQPTGAAPYADSHSNTSSIDAGSIRLDQALGKHLTLFGRYSYSPSSIESRGGSNPSEVDRTGSRIQSLTVGANWSISSSLNNEFRLNYSRVNADLEASQSPVGGAQRINPSYLTPTGLSLPKMLNRIRVTDHRKNFFLNIGPFEKNLQRQINFADAISYAFGRHQLKLGVDFRRLSPLLGPLDYESQSIISGETNIQNGTVSSLFLLAQKGAEPLFQNFSSFGQDTWRASRRLSLTYGLRWEINPAPSEAHGLIPYNVIGMNNPPTASLASPGTPQYSTTFNNFAPRFGAAFVILQRASFQTVIRAGVGSFYDLGSDQAASGYSSIPFAALSASRNVAYPLTATTAPPPPFTFTPPFDLIYAIDPHLKLPYSVQWNVALDQSLGANQQLSISYVASEGKRLLRQDNLQNFNPEFVEVLAVRNAASSNYQSMQLQFTRRLTRGLQGLASYSYSHSLDDASTGVSPTNATTTFFNPLIDKGASDFDVRHAVRGALTYNVPTWKANFVSKAVLGDWSIDAIGLAQTGLPVDLIGGFAQDSSGTSVRPDLSIPRQPLYIYGSAFPGGRSFNPAAFSPVPVDSSGNPLRQGTLGRNVMRGFGASQLDFGLHRRFQLNEAINLQFRSEFFNIFNHPNFGQIDNFCCDPPFGQAGATLSNSLGSGGAGLSSLYQIGGPRSIQFALKLQF
jgi:hypothetical protein